MALSLVGVLALLAAVASSADAARQVQGIQGLPSYLPQDYLTKAAGLVSSTPVPTLTAAAAAASGATTAPTELTYQALGSATGVSKPFTLTSGGSGAGGRRLSQTGLFDAAFRWHGGAVMTGTVNVYLLYVGYSATDALPSWANYLVANLQGSGLWLTTTKYYRGSTYASGGMKLAKTLFFGNTALDLGVNGVFSFIVAQMNKGSIPVDPNGIYVLMPSATSLSMSRNFASGACGWHTYGTVGGTSVKIALVPQFPASNAGCVGVHSYLTNSGKTSPSGDPSIDSVMSVLFHELHETVTDPELNAWYGADLAHENGDLCAWQFTTSDRSGSYPRTLPTNTWPNPNRYTSYNQLIAGVPFILQLAYNPDPKASGCIATIATTLRSDGALGSAACLAAGQCLISKSNGYMACMQTDGNVVVYARSSAAPGSVSVRALWASRTFPTSTQQLCMQGDGNLVGYAGNWPFLSTAFWASRTQGRGVGPWRLIMQDDGNLVVYDKNNLATWASNTMQG